MTIETIETYDGQGNLVDTQSREVPPEELTERRRQRTGQTLSTEEYDAVRAQMQVLRDGRQLGRNGFMALPEAERWRMLYDAVFQNQTEILLVMLRDEP